MRALSSVLVEFDHLTAEEFDFLEILVKPRGITRGQYRDELAAGRFNARSFVENVNAMRVAAGLADTQQAWGGPQPERPRSALRLVHTQPNREDNR